MQFTRQVSRFSILRNIDHLFNQLFQKMHSIYAEQKYMKGFNVPSNLKKGTLQYLSVNTM